MKSDGESELESAAASSTALSISGSRLVPRAERGAETVKKAVGVVAGAVLAVTEQVIEAVWKLGSGD